jgi:hypothetical protein
MLERKEKEREKNSTRTGMPVKKWKGQNEDGRM